MAFTVPLGPVFALQRFPFFQGLATILRWALLVCGVFKTAAIRGWVGAIRSLTHAETFPMGTNFILRSGSTPLPSFVAKLTFRASLTLASLKEFAQRFSCVACGLRVLLNWLLMMFTPMTPPTTLIARFFCKI